MENRYEKALAALGMRIIAKTSNERLETVSADIETKKGPFWITVGTNGCGVFLKPNGTSKWVYEKSPAQICRIAQQVIKANN